MRRLTLLLTFITTVSFAQNDSTTVSSSDDLFDLSLQELLNLELVDKNFYLYGYINSNMQKTFDYPHVDEYGNTYKESDPAEWNPVKDFHIYGQGNLSSHISFLFNLAKHNDLVEIRNAYGNFAFKDALQVRVGKMYRRFGLYNEKLDQIPTFIGIEAPEMLDSDHLFVMRTTNFMLHGILKNSSREISYALMTDNGENGPAKKLMPLGYDLRYKSYVNSLIFGFSGYASSVTSARATSTVALGDGPPTGGILPWMAADKFNVLGLFVEKQIGNVLIQSEYYNAKHHAERNPEAVLSIVQNAGINENQRARFLGANADKETESITAADVVTKTAYNVQTWYVRVGYNVRTNIGQFVPYLFVDWMSHPENIQNKQYGGDDEAGLADDGKFIKPSAGVVYRPIPTVAIKLDGSYHSQQFNGRQVMYPELRLDFSFTFSNSSIERMLKD